MNEKEIKVIEIIDKDFSNTLQIFVYKNYLTFSVEDWGDCSRSMIDLPKKTIKKLIVILQDLIKEMESVK